MYNIPQDVEHNEIVAELQVVYLNVSHARL